VWFRDRSCAVTCQETFTFGLSVRMANALLLTSDATMAWANWPMTVNW
jgi:hypothetical protein